MNGILLEDYDSNINDYFYKKGQKVDVTELENFEKYAIYRIDTIDWIPKNLVKIKGIKKMEDKYLIIYQNSSCLFRKEIVSESDLGYWVNKVINDYKGTIFTISKCLITI